MAIIFFRNCYNFLNVLLLYLPSSEEKMDNDFCHVQVSWDILEQGLVNCNFQPNAVCLLVLCGLWMIFTFLNGWDKKKPKNIDVFWHVKIIWNSNFCVHKPSFIKTRPSLFTYILLVIYDPQSLKTLISAFLKKEKCQSLT